MKRIIGVFSLFILLLSNFLPIFTYANGGDLVDENALISNQDIGEESELNNETTPVSNTNSDNTDTDNTDTDSTDTDSTDSDNTDTDSTDTDNTDTDSTDSDNTNSDNTDFIDVAGVDNSITLNGDDYWDSCFGVSKSATSATAGHYNCSDTDIVIPSNIGFINAGTFEGVTITSLSGSNSTRLQASAFSGAILNSGMTFPGNFTNHDTYYLQDLHIGPQGNIIITEPTKTYKMVIEGVLRFEFPDDGNTYSLNYPLNNSRIEGGRVYIPGSAYGIQYLMQYSTMTEGSILTIGEGVHVLDHSFYSGNFKGTINLPNSLERITNNSFKQSNISGDFAFGSNLKEIASSAFCNGTYTGNFLFNDNETQLVVGGFGESNIYGNIKFSNSNVRISGLSNSIINGKVEFRNSIVDSNSAFSNSTINGDFEMLGGNGNMAHWGSMTVNGNLSVNGDHYIGDTPGKLTVSGDLTINSNSDFSLNYGGSPWSIGRNLTFSGQNISIGNSSFNSVNVSGDLRIISNNTINISSSAMSNLRVNGDMFLSGNQISFVNGGKGIYVDGKVYLLGNISKSNGGFEGGYFNSVYIKYPINYISGFIVNGNLVIDNSDNAPANEFLGKDLGGNIYLNGEISKAGAGAYAFGSGKIQPIVLSSTFNTGDIGENAFCINGNPVIAYTMKNVSSSERDYLLEHACLDVKGAFKLTFNNEEDIIEIQYNGRNTDEIPNPTKKGYEFLGWYEINSVTPFNFDTTIITEDKTFNAKWKALQEKAQEISDNVVYTDDTTVEINDEGVQPITGTSTIIELKTKEVESEEVKTDEDKTKVQESEIKVSSDKTVEYQGGLEIYLEKTENAETKIITGTAKFSAPIAVKIPVISNSEYVKVQVKHYGEEFGYKGLTLNPVNECNNGEAVNDKYNGEDIKIKESNGEKYVLIYTCSASTFVAYSETNKTINVSPASGGGRTIKQETKPIDQEHNSADTEKTNVHENTKTVSNQTTNTQSIQEKVKSFSNKSITRGELAVMTNILLDVFPQLTENKSLSNELDVCENYVDEQNFTKDEKKAITRLCKLSIMGIHKDNNEPLDEFLVKQIATNGEFATVMDRVVANYTEKDLSVVKEALKKLGNGDEGVVFGTVYDVFMSIKNIFN